MNCRHCQAQLTHLFLDLGEAPPSNAYLDASDLNGEERCFPLRVFVCDKCWLVQTEDFSRCDELFTSDYAYFSSVSKSWLAHAEEYCAMIQKRLMLGEQSMVVEIASNDGYLLRNFKKAGIPCLGIEPTDSTADASEELGIPVLRRFFGAVLAEQLVKEGNQADLIIGNNVFAHVPDINDFTRGLKVLLKPNGTITLEFPHLKNLIELNQFDTIYHEHYSYLSLSSVSQIFQSEGLKIYDVESLPTHGGSLRIFGCHMDCGFVVSESVEAVLQSERDAGLLTLQPYQTMQHRADKAGNDLKQFLLEQKRAGKTVAAYGAAAKGNTLLNFADIDNELVAFVCDAAPSKQGKYMPGSRIPIVGPDRVEVDRPDFLLILPWNIKDEIIKRNASIREWGGQFVIAIPELELIP